jgi:hypothetical protein
LEIKTKQIKQTMQTQQQRDSAIQNEARSKKPLDSNITAAAATEGPLNEEAADASKEAAADAISEKPMQHRHEKHLENERKEQEEQMLSLGRTEKEAQRSKLMAHAQLQEAPVPEQPTAHLFEKKEEQPREFLEGLPGRREDLGAKIEGKVQDVKLMGERDVQPQQEGAAHSKKKQHKKLSSKQLQQQQQELEETENVHQSQKREPLEPNSPSSTSTDSADKEHRETLKGKEAIGDVHAKQSAHEGPYPKKQRERLSEGEQPHLTKQQLQEHELKQAGSSRSRKQKKEVQHHNKPERENPREPSPASTTSSSTSGSEPVAHGRHHELVNKDLPRDQIHDQEKLHTSQPLGTLQESQERLGELPTKSKQSEAEKEMSTRIGSQLPAKQEPTGQQGREASNLKPSQKKDYAPPQ